MQRVIDRKLYDTDRAEQIAQHAPNTDRGDFHYLIETLYKISEGEYDELRGRCSDRIRQTV